METLLQTYCFEIEVTCAQASEQDAFVRRMALHLVQYLAVFLAETITGLLQRVLTHSAQALVDETNAALLTQKFWVQAIYTELLCASSGLVKVVCLPFDGAAAQKHGRRKATDARSETMIGRSSWVDSLFVGAVAFTDRSHIELPEALEPTRSNGGRLTQGAAAQCYNHASMLTGSHLTRKCLLLFSPD